MLESPKVNKRFRAVGCGDLVNCLSRYSVVRKREEELEHTQEGRPHWEYVENLLSDQTLRPLCRSLQAAGVKGVSLLRSLTAAGSR